MRHPQIALESTGLPAYFGAWQGDGGLSKPPEAYLVYTLMATPDEHSDNCLRAYAVYAYVNLWTVSNPSDPVDSVRAAMASDGWSMVDEIVDYDDGSGMFRVSWTWVTWEDADHGA